MKTKETKVTIWSSDINMDDWKSYIAEEYSEYPDTCNSVIKDLLDRYFDECEKENASVDDFIKKYEYELYDEISYINNDYLGDERINLDIETKGKIICIADLGLWNGRRSGYKYMGKNIKNCLCSLLNGDSNIEFYVEKVKRTLEFKACEGHHDGTNHYTYRELKPYLSDSQIENFENKLYEGTATDEDVRRYTNPLGKSISEVYGWFGCTYIPKTATA